MIYSASFFEPQNHYGKLISIARSEPGKVKLDGKLEFFVPSAKLLRDYDCKDIDHFEYIDRYREEMRVKLPQIRAWIDSLDPKIDMTLLCWEKQGKFCRRNLAIAFVESWRPDCFGGRDVKNTTFIAGVPTLSLWRSGEG